MNRVHLVISLSNSKLIIHVNLFYLFITGAVRTARTGPKNLPPCPSPSQLRLLLLSMKNLPLCPHIVAGTHYPIIDDYFHKSSQNFSCKKLLFINHIINQQIFHFFCGIIVSIRAGPQGKKPISSMSGDFVFAQPQSLPPRDGNR
jgi:hypothetical protein